MEEISAEEIRERIRENLKRGRPGTGNSRTEVVPPKREDEAAAVPPTPVPAREDGKDNIDSLLWRYGTRYAKVIKKIPFLRDVAERYYWKLVFPRERTLSTVMPDRQKGERMGLNYRQFLEEIRKEGLKGKAKLLIFKFIGFFAFWQEQINSTLHQELSGLRAEVAEKDALLRELTHDVETLRARVAEKLGMMDELDRRLTALSRTEDALYQDVTDLRAEIAEKAGAINEIDGRLTALSRTEDALYQDVTDLRAEMAERMWLFEESLRRKSGSPGDEVTGSAAYFSFEDVFRGSREMIKNRQYQYLDYAREAHRQSKGSYLLDIGCGRGEFLEILTDSGVPSKGVDLNEQNVAVCRKLGLEAELADALTFMESAGDDSLTGVTAFQVVEHLETGYLLELLNLSFRKIRKGGVLILETVNPNSLYALRNFFLDPTHKNPLPPDTLKFLVESCGFVNVEVRFSSPVGTEMMLKGEDENTRKLNEMLFGFQDYAIIGRKTINL